MSGDTDSTGRPCQAALNIGGHVKASVVGGEDSDGEARIVAATPQLSLKLEAEKPNLGKAYAEARLDAGSMDGDLTVELDSREAWAAAYPGPVDVWLCRQFVV